MEFLLKAVAEARGKPKENHGLQKQIGPWIVRHVQKCLKYDALLATGSVGHKVVSLIVFVLCPLHGFNMYELM